MLERRSDPSVGCGQGMEGKGCIQVMFSVEGHIPHLPGHYGVREGGTGIAGAIGIKAAAAVLRQHRQSEKRLTNGQG